MLVSAVALGLIGGLAFGGSWRRLLTLEIRWLPLLFVAFAQRIVGSFIPMPWPFYLAAVLSVAVVAIRNWRLPGAALIGIGSALNALVITLNGGMPVDPAAAASVGLAVVRSGLHVPLTAETILPFLADVIAFPFPRNVYSVGDFVIAAGGFWLPFALLRSRERQAA